MLNVYFCVSKVVVKVREIPYIHQEIRQSL